MCTKDLYKGKGKIHQIKNKKFYSFVLSGCYGSCQYRKANLYFTLRVKLKLSVAERTLDLWVLVTHLSICWKMQQISKCQILLQQSECKTTRVGWSEVDPSGPAISENSTVLLSLWRVLVRGSEYGYYRQPPQPIIYTSTEKSSAAIR